MSAFTLPSGLTIDLRRTDYRNRTYYDFRAAKSHGCRGWVVDGRGIGPDTYGDSIVMLCATLPGKPTGRNTWRAFPTKKDAQAVATALNLLFPIPAPAGAD